MRIGCKEKGGGRGRDTRLLFVPPSLLGQVCLQFCSIKVCVECVANAFVQLEHVEGPWEAGGERWTG